MSKYVEICRNMVRIMVGKSTKLNMNKMAIAFGLSLLDYLDAARQVPCDQNLLDKTKKEVLLQCQVLHQSVVNQPQEASFENDSRYFKLYDNALELLWRGQEHNRLLQFSPSDLDNFDKLCSKEEFPDDFSAEVMVTSYVRSEMVSKLREGNIAGKQSLCAIMLKGQELAGRGHKAQHEGCKALVKFLEPKVNASTALSPQDQDKVRLICENNSLDKFRVNPLIMRVLQYIQSSARLNSLARKLPFFNHGKDKILDAPIIPDTQNRAMRAISCHH